jgi:hypothetical protein
VLSENISNLCLFFENPSRNNEITARILSRRVNFSETRIEIWTSHFERVPCRKNKCHASLRSKYFIRIVGARSGLRVGLSGTFQHHDLATLCSREPVTVWDANLTYAANLPTEREKFYCDESHVAKMEQQRNLIVVSAVLATVVIGGVVWLWRRRSWEGFKVVPSQLQQKGGVSKEESLRGGEKFYQTAGL